MSDEPISAIAARPTNRAVLPDIHDVRPLDTSDAVLLAELREVLTRHNALDRFGITLIHQHFDLAPDETLVEVTDVENRTLTIRPAKRADVPAAIETSWQFLPGVEDAAASLHCHIQCVVIGSQHIFRHPI